MCIRQRIGGSNPPLTAIFEMRARTKVRALFFYILRRGDENPRPGFDNWRSQLDRLERSEQAARRASTASQSPLTAIFEIRARTQVRALFFYILRKGGMRTPDRGSTTGAASWTDRERSEQAARRASAASQSPLTAIFEKELVRKYGLFFRILHACGRDENSRLGFDNWLHPTMPHSQRRQPAPQ